MIYKIYVYNYKILLIFYESFTTTTQNMIGRPNIGPNCNKRKTVPTKFSFLEQLQQKNPFQSGVSWGEENVWVGEGMVAASWPHCALPVAHDPSWYHLPLAPATLPWTGERYPDLTGTAHRAQAASSPSQASSPHCDAAVVLVEIELKLLLLLLRQLRPPQRTYKKLHNAV